MTKTFIAVALGLLVSSASIYPAIAASAEPMGVMHVIARIAGPDGGWDFASYDAAHRRMYFSRDNGVTAIDIDTGAVHPRFARGADVHSVVVIPGGQELVTTNSGDDTARFVSATDGTLIAAVHTGKKPDAAAYDPASDLIFVMNGDSGTITAIDPRTRKAAKT
ncbi:MAG: YncE family protein, partial [Bradyrhizobium sp.]